MAISDHAGRRDDLALAQRAALAGAHIGRGSFGRVRRLAQERKADGSLVAGTALFSSGGTLHAAALAHLAAG